MTPTEALAKALPLAEGKTWNEAAAAILAALPPDWCGHQADVRHLCDVIERQGAEIARLRRDLRRWNVSHANNCRATVLGPDAICTCGLSAALEVKP